MTDYSQREPDAPRSDWTLPKVLDIKIKKIPYQAPKLRNFKSSLEQYKEAIEFIVKTDGPIPIRALGPVLYVGEAVVGEGSEIKKNQYRFLAFEFDELKSEAPISLSWPGEPPAKQELDAFRFSLNKRRK